METYTPPSGCAIIGIDPGTEHTAVVLLEPGEAGPSFHKILPNDQVLIECGRILHALAVSYPAGLDVHVGMEMIACYGMPVGESTFATVLWIGYYVANFPQLASPVHIRKVYRKDVKMHLCQSMRANDGNIRQALVDQFPATGGGAVPQKGTKAEPGPLYGFNKDEWAALGVAITAKDLWGTLSAFPMTSEPLLN